MKNVAFIAAFFLVVGCQSREKDIVITNKLSKAEVLSKFTGGDPLMNAPQNNINVRAASLSKEDMLAKVERERLARIKLAEMAPIPVPQEGGQVSISVEEAHKKYKNFLNQYAGDLFLLSLFKQTYARVLLNQYGLLESHRYELVEYYVDQLISARSNDFRSITLGLLTIEGKVDSENFNRLKTTAVFMAEKRLALEQNALPHFIAMNNKLKEKKAKNEIDANDRTLLIGMDKVIYNIEHSDAKACLSILKK